MPRGDSDDPDVRFPFGHDHRAAGKARRALDAVLNDPDDVIAEDVRLVASELVTNVVLHTPDGGEMRVWDPKPDVPLRLEVEDTANEKLPSVPDEPSHQGGRGLAIVDAVSEGWGVEQIPAGKIVWAEFDRNRRTTGQ